MEGAALGARKVTIEEVYESLLSALRATTTPGHAIDWNLALRWAAFWGIEEKIAALQARGV